MRIEEYIILGVIVAIIFVPMIAWRIYRIYSRSKANEEILSKPFVCPNCGHRFYTQQKVVRIIGENKAYLKCPSCGKSDVCGRPYDIDN